jgi:nitroreductase
MTEQVDLTARRETLDFIYRRRAVRSYKADRVDEATIRALLEAAVHAPTAMHLEPWTFVVVQDKATLKRYSDRAKAMLVTEVAKHQDPRKPPAGHSARDHIGLLADPGFNIFYDAGTLIVICGKPMGQFVVADCWLGAENLMLAASALDLGTCCIGFALPVLNTPEVKRELGLDDDVTAVAAIIVGIPRTSTPPVPRKPPEIVRWMR